MQDQFLAVGLAVLVIVDEQREVRFLGYVDAFRRELEADGNMQMVGEDRLLIGLTVAIRVFEDDQFVIG